MTDDVYCTQSSLAASETMIGSATATEDLWVLLEFCGRWGSKALEGTELPVPVRAAIDELLAAQPRARFQLIRRPESRSGESRIIIASTADAGRFCRQATAPSVEALASIDLAALVDGSTGEELEEPLYLVCTHGKRDRCCALHGLPIFKALRELAPERVWQTSHLGGHRFAPTLLTLTDGHVYGRLDMGDTTQLFHAVEHGRVFDLTRLRGRAGWPPAAQAAERALRRKLRDLDSPMVLQSCEETGADQWTVRIDDSVVTVGRSMGAEPVRASCAQEKMSLPARYTAQA